MKTQNWIGIGIYQDFPVTIGLIARTQNATAEYGELKDTWKAREQNVTISFLCWLKQANSLPHLA